MFKKIIYTFILLALLSNSFIINIYATDKIGSGENSTTYVWSNQTKNSIEDKTLSTSAPLDLTEAKDNNSLGLESGSACLMEQTTGMVLYNHNMHEKLRPASVTKVMSLLLIMEALDSGRISLTDKVPCTDDAAAMGGSQIWLDQTETLTVEEMLKAICVVSANDCVVAMANFLEGSQNAFVNKMNERAKQLNMNDTTFKNCHGIDEDGHLTSAYDIAIMSRELMLNHPEITKYTTIYMDSLRDGKSTLVNTNKLVRNYDGCTGLKTGSTSIALYNLSATATRNNLSFIAVIMKAPSTKIRFAEAKKLLDYGFNTFEYKKLGSKNDIIQNIRVNKGIINNVDVKLENDAGILFKKGNTDEIEKNIELEDTINAPVLEGQKLGEIIYSINNETISKVNLVANKEIKKTTLPLILKKNYLKWFSVFRK